MKSNIFIFFVIIIFICFGCQEKNINNSKNNQNDIIYGKVIHIADGDTYTLLVEKNKKIRVRMHGIDAPEKTMPFYSVSKNFLKNLIFQKEIKLKKVGQDRYGRTLGYTFLLDGTDITHEMLKAGMVWHFKRYSNDKILSKLEHEAKIKKNGLWIDENPIAPWEFRKNNRIGK